jgi:catechol 2,3-dioxygenase-like lactoylglutathione lyase family enzyme
MAELLGPLRQIGVSVSDLERATAYYRDVLGFPLLFTAPNVAFFNLGAARLMLGPASPDRPVTASTLLYFSVADLKRDFATLVARGAIGKVPPQRTADLGQSELWIGYVADHDGNLYGLMQEIAKS